jgi:alpha-amylase/alpha-mannosidase (GH57 family)
MAENNKLRIAILWHMHQPYYLNPKSQKFFLPWVRFHCLKDYLDMPLLAARYPKIKITFNLVPSLLDQIQMYCDGFIDRHQELSGRPARDLSPEEKKEILSTFFSAHPVNMIEPFARYRQLYKKRESCGQDLNLAVELFSTAEWRDLQVWSSLCWIDPLFRKESPIRELLDKGRDFSEEDKAALSNFQLDLIKRIIPTYQKLLAENLIDISFTPYYHPILPLLVDTDSAKEALPGITLPHNRFSFPEDARWQINQSAEKFNAMFGKKLTGMWPSEGSISEDVLKIITETGIKWIASDEDILHQSYHKAGRTNERATPHTAYAYGGAPGIKLFFRDRGLSDKIGFVYSSWEPDRAVNDFITTLEKIREFLKDDLKNKIVPIILDGENAWEYYRNDGYDFLNKLYMALSENEQIETISFTEAAESIESTSLSAVMAGSWINHNFRIWIGHSEDNSAWDMLYNARKALIDYQKNNPAADPTRLESAWKQIHIAEGSDWCWWYGDDHIGAHNDQFDELFRLHIASIYDILGLTPPANLFHRLHRGKSEASITYPESLVTPQMDGLLTHYYEWSGAGLYDCLRTGGTMHRAERAIDGIYFAFDAAHFYIRLDFAKKFNLVGIKNGRIIIDFKNIGQKEIRPEKTSIKDLGDFQYSYQQILEIRFGRKDLLPKNSGHLEFFVLFYSGDELLEKWPIDDPIAFDIPEIDREIFWQV